MGSPYSFEFHLIWKVASTSFPSYLDCAYGNESDGGAAPDGPSWARVGGGAARGGEAEGGRIE